MQREESVAAAVVLVKVATEAVLSVAVVVAALGRSRGYAKLMFRKKGQTETYTRTNTAALWMAEGARVVCSTASGLDFLARELLICSWLIIICVI